MKALYLLGTGGLARELFGWMKAENDPLLKSFQGFLVTDYHPVNESLYNFPVIGINELDNNSFNYILTISSSSNKRKVVSQLESLNGTAVSFISRNSCIGYNSKIGKGVIINPRCSVSSDVIIGDYVLINCNSGIGHDVKVGEFSSILGNVALNGDVSVAPDCLIGSGAIVHPGLNISEGATIGMGAVVFRNVKPGITVLGNPAKKL